MAYELHNFQKGDILYSSQLNEMDEQILNNETLAIRALDNQYKLVYVDGVNGNDLNDGTSENPYQTITKAIGDSDYKCVYVKAGIYHERVSISSKHNIKITLWEMPSTYNKNITLPMIIIDGGISRDIDIGLSAYNCGNIELSDIHVRNTSSHGFDFKNCNHVTGTHLIADNNGRPNEEPLSTCGLRVQNSNGVFRDCIARYSARDGFNIHGYGNTQFINCTAHNCGDDGISHHDSSTGVIIGGEWYNNVKGGIASPTYGANINVINVYSHDNGYGLYSSSNPDYNDAYGHISGCVFKNNTHYDIQLKENTTNILWNTIYDTKHITTESTLVEF